MDAPSRRFHVAHASATGALARAGARPGERAFTLIEIGAVVFVMALVMGMAVPTLRSVSGARARSEAANLAANIRATRGHAAVAGETCRMVLCIDGCSADGDENTSGGASSYSIECVKGVVPMTPEASRNGGMDIEDEDEPDDRLTPAEKARREVLARTRFASTSTLPNVPLASLRMTSVWTAHQPEKYTKGRAYLYFYPSGRSERANIQLRDGDDWYTLQVSPLSGRVKVLTGREELPDQREEED